MLVSIARARLGDYVLDLPLSMVWDILDYDVELEVHRAEPPPKTIKAVGDLKALAQALNA